MAGLFIQQEPLVHKTVDMVQPVWSCGQTEVFVKPCQGQRERESISVCPETTGAIASLTNKSINKDINTMVQKFLLTSKHLQVKWNWCVMGFSAV